MKKLKLLSRRVYRNRANVGTACPGMSARNRSRECVSVGRYRERVSAGRYRQRVNTVSVGRCCERNRYRYAWPCRSLS